jgi:hypothetical protein
MLLTCRATVFSLMKELVGYGVIGLAGGKQTEDLRLSFAE